VACTHEFVLSFSGGGMDFYRCKLLGCGKLESRRHQEARGTRWIKGVGSDPLVVVSGTINNADPDGCSSCGEEMPEGECPDSRRTCGHHCNHSWSHDHCDWCKKNFACCNNCGKDMVLSDTAMEAFIADGGDILCNECRKEA
jgi:hypothetical protein